MEKVDVDKKEYEKFVSEVATMVIQQAEKEDNMEDLVESTVDIVKNDPAFGRKILGYIFSNPDLKKELKNAVIDEVCD